MPQTDAGGSQGRPAPAVVTLGRTAWQGVAKLSRAVRRPRERFAKLIGGKKERPPAEQPQAGPAVRPVFGFRKTGFWLEELAAPYYVFEDAGAPLSPKSPINGTR
jgi:hypothetical protein